MHDLSSDSRRSRIFVVDDEWIIAESLAALLEKNGFRAQAFHNPGQALVRAMDSPPDVLISDVMMPGMTGLELAVSLRRAGNPCRILLVSGQSDAAEMVGQARRQGYRFELLSKPLNLMRLLLRLRHMGRPAASQHLLPRDAVAAVQALSRPA